jgi:mRNA degradation ribonuclease J1/J2
MSVSAHVAPAGVPPVDVVPLGGLGEFGLNMMAISCGETTIVIDAGAMFPETDLPGVDLIVPDLAYLEGRRGQLKALVLTHAPRITSAGCLMCCPTSTALCMAPR